MKMNRMQPARLLVVALLELVLLMSAPAALDAGRVALVVGNSTYAHIGRLPNAENDATDMSAALRRLGFEVKTELDADRVALNEALRAFTRRSAGADVALVFYAGHGIEMDGANYLVPVDARLERDVDVRFEAVTLEDLLASTLGASLRLVILDACRNNPLARSMQQTLAGRSVSGGSFGDLNEDLLGAETLVAYAAAAGTTAADGRGRNSIYLGVAGLPGATAGDRPSVPPGASTGAGVDERLAASARVSVAGGRALSGRAADGGVRHCRSGGIACRRGRRGGGRRGGARGC